MDSYIHNHPSDILHIHHQGLAFLYNFHFYRTKISVLKTFFSLLTSNLSPAEQDDLEGELDIALTKVYRKYGITEIFANIADLFSVTLSIIASALVSLTLTSMILMWLELVSDSSMNVRRMIMNV